MRNISSQAAKTRLARVTLFTAVLLATLAAAVVHPSPADARVDFPDGANGMAGASCDGLNWRLQAGSYPAVYFRFHVYDQQRRVYVYTSSWQVVNGVTYWPSFGWYWGPGRFSIYGEFARVIGGQWYYGTELAGVLNWRTDIVRGQIFCWNW